ncbi:DoxX family protein [Carnimonas bestiolae]|uniref:DoxX family protein n=1 Tax=Carnimonas bestiolae TaxID=3402172 RepID=UPI003F4A9930
MDPTLAAVMMIAAGIVEFSLAISVGLRLLTRAGGLLGVIYFLIATVVFGGEWSSGYRWNTPNGGWEYVLLILVVFGSTAYVDAGKFSLDGWLDATPASITVYQSRRNSQPDALTAPVRQ